MLRGPPTPPKYTGSFAWGLWQPRQCSACCPGSEVAEFMALLFQLRGGGVIAVPIPAGSAVVPRWTAVHTGRAAVPMPFHKPTPQYLPQLATDAKPPRVSLQFRCIFSLASEDLFYPERITEWSAAARKWLGCFAQQAQEVLQIGTHRRRQRRPVPPDQRSCAAIEAPAAARSPESSSVSWSKPGANRWRTRRSTRRKLPKTV